MCKICWKLWERCGRCAGNCRKGATDGGEKAKEMVEKGLEMVER
jgi:hypothetical protein